MGSRVCACTLGSSCVWVSKTQRRANTTCWRDSAPKALGCAKKTVSDLGIPINVNWFLVESSFFTDVLFDGRVAGHLGPAVGLKP